MSILLCKFVGPYLTFFAIHIIYFDIYEANTILTKLDLTTNLSGGGYSIFVS